MAADYEAAVSAQCAVVVEIAGGIRGYMIGWPEGDTYFIENVGVDPQYQGRGLGRQLIDHAVTEARRHRLQALSLYTNEAMTENLAMYAHLGFVETHRVTEHGFGRVYMRRALANPDG
jgi:ribosomal protein S18 acetylase RimI-like enzyme